MEGQKVFNLSVSLEKDQVSESRIKISYLYKIYFVITLILSFIYNIYIVIYYNKSLETPQEYDYKIIDKNLYLTACANIGVLCVCIVSLPYIFKLPSKKYNYFSIILYLYTIIISIWCLNTINFKFKELFSLSIINITIIPLAVIISRVFRFTVEHNLTPTGDSSSSSSEITKNLTVEPLVEIPEIKNPVETPKVVIPTENRKIYGRISETTGKPIY